MDCRTARLLLDFAHPRSTELEPSEIEALEGHLAVCSECEAQARIERQIDDHIGGAIRAVVVPDNLHQRITARLQAERERRRRRVLAWTARAASLLLLIGGIAVAAVYLRSHQLPELDVDGLHSIAILEPAPTRELVEERFKERYGRAIVAPLRFNYHLLASYELADFQGKKLPLLVFAHGNDRARVYIVTDRDFNLEALLRTERSDSAGQAIEVWPHPENPHVAYVVICNSGSLWRFLTNDPHHAA